MQINKELLERALAEGVEVEDNPDHTIISLATNENTRWTGFCTTSEWINPSRWEYVCTLTEYLKAKAEKEKMPVFKAGDLVDVVNANSKICVGVKLKYLSSQNLIVSHGDEEFRFVSEQVELRLHRKTQDWFGVEIDAFMTEKPKTGAEYWFFSPAHKCAFSIYVFKEDNTDNLFFNVGVWDSEEKAKRSAPLMRQRLIEMAGVSCKEK